MSYQEMLFTFLGGLGIFLFGIKYLGDGLQKAAGNRLREILNRFTSTPFRAVLAGLLVTGVIQSSSGTTVLAVGLVSAGFMTLRQAIGVIMGANVGTTVTAFIIGFNLSEYALPIIGVGAILLFFAKRPSLQSIGQILFGFGALFYGLKLMGSAMDPLKELPQFNDLMISVSHHPILGVGIGTLLTMVLQSSSATIGILQQLYMQGSVTLGAALPILFGDNIGTTITAVIACLGASVAAKRTAASHVIFNLFGAVLFTILLTPFTGVVVVIADTLGLNPAMQLSEPIIHTSSVMAIEQAKGEIVQMGHYVISSLEAARKYYHENKEEWHDDAQQYEDAINQCDIELTEYLVKISMAELSPLESQEQAMLLEFTKDFERIGDHSMNILRYVEESIALEEKQRAKDKRNKTSTTNGRQTFLLQDEDLERLFDKVLKNVRDALQVLENDDIALAQKMLERETEINQLVELLRKKYIRLMTKGEGRAADGVLLIDISSNLERSSDRTLHIAKYIIGNKYNFKYDTSNFHYEVPEEPAETPLTNTSEVLD